MNEVLDVAILAYRHRRFGDAIQLLLHVAAHEPNNWLARLYLGMAFEKTGRIGTAYRVFQQLAAECSDNSLRNKARWCLPLLETEMRRRFGRKAREAKREVDARARQAGVSAGSHCEARAGDGNAQSPGPTLKNASASIDAPTPTGESDLSPTKIRIAPKGD